MMKHLVPYKCNEPNKRNIKFIWDGFLLFVDSDVTIEHIKNGIDLYNGRLVALQRITPISTQSIASNNTDTSLVDHKSHFEG